MKARGILMADALAQACAEGRKTQTRRPLESQPQFGSKVPGLIERWRERGGVFYRETRRPEEWAEWTGAECYRCPFGAPGNLLYVRECWAVAYEADHRGTLTSLIPSGEDQQRALRRVLYRAKDAIPADVALPWRPSIHMPRWAARTWLRITDVRVERVQAISEADAIAEGKRGDGPTINSEEFLRKRMPHAVYQFARSWNNLYAAKGLGWDANPWVWVLAFEKCKAPA